MNKPTINRKTKIQSLISELVTEARKESKQWIAGEDIVQYAGTYFSNDEFEAGIESLLNGWWALGENGM